MNDKNIKEINYQIKGFYDPAKVSVADFIKVLCFFNLVFVLRTVRSELSEYTSFDMAKTVQRTQQCSCRQSKDFQTLENRLTARKPAIRIAIARRRKLLMFYQNEKTRRSKEFSERRPFYLEDYFARDQANQSELKW